MIFAYLLLALSIGCELVAASVTTSTRGFTVPGPTVICILGYGFSYYFFGLCLSDIDLSIGYATWGAVGTVVTPIVGYFVYKQKISRTGVFALFLIIVSIITLNLFGS